MLEPMSTPRRLLRSLALIVTLLAAGCASGAGITPSGDLVSIGAGLQGLAGLRATRYTTGPVHLSAFAIDGQGRLWLSTAAATDDGTDGVYLVARAGAEPLEVISAMHTPLGLLWIHEVLYVASKDRIDAFGGFNGTTFTTHRTVITFPSGTGEVNGLVQAPDGRLWVGISAPCDHCSTSPPSAAVLSLRTDGSDEQVEARNIRAAVGLAFVPGTSQLLASSDQRDDLGAKTPGDELVELAHGQDYRFPGCYGQGGSACSGVPDAVATLDVHGGVDGVAVVTDQLGSSVGTAAVVAEYAVGKVQLVTLTADPSGTGYAGTTSDLLSGIANPVPVIVGPDGALFVGDWKTGAVYRITKA